jgi:glutamine amidotransferase
MKSKIIIIDYNIGNTNSIYNALKYLGYNISISNNASEIDKADFLILPGVGAFEEAMNNITKLNLLKILEKNVFQNKKPILGICLGMQLLATDSEENGFHHGLNWIPGSVKKIKVKRCFKVPHVGWNEVIPNNNNHNNNIFFSNSVFNKPNFYWDHSYYFDCKEEHKIAICNYDIEIPAIIGKENIFGIQFHPEKSQTNGLRIFRSLFNHFNIK